MRKMATELGKNCESLRKLVHEDLELKSLKRKIVHQLTPALRRKRLVRCKGLLRRIAPQDLDKVLFSDEKLFTVGEVNNRQNDGILNLDGFLMFRQNCICQYSKKTLSGRSWPDVLKFSIRSFSNYISFKIILEPRKAATLPIYPICQWRLANRLKVMIFEF